MKKIPSIEVVIVTYNRAVYFEQALRSVCNQTYKNLTIKVFDNGSTDNTAEVYEKVKADYPMRRFCYMKLSENHQDAYFIDKKNDFITADYVIVFHDDDLMHPRYVEFLMRIIVAHPDIVLLGGKTIPSYHPEKLQWCTPKGDYIIGDVRDMAKWYYRGDTFSFPAICYKSIWYKTEKFNHELYGNRGDFPFVMDIAEHGKVCELQDRYLHYRVHKTQTARTLPTIEQRINLVKKIADKLLTGDDECKRVFYDRIYYDCTRVGFINYDIAKKYHWVSPQTERKFQKAYTYHRWQKKMLFYKIMFYLAKKVRFLPFSKYIKRYAKQYHRYKVRLLITQAKLNLRHGGYRVLYNLSSGEKNEE